jgi:glycosyltransferase involved in cell wall biosynthesis
MRVSIVTETYPPEINGVALTVQSLVRGLGQLGHDVSLVRPRQPDAPEATEGSDGSDELLVPGAALPRYPGLRFGLPVYRRVLAFWRDHRPDAVYIATEGPLGWAALRAARKLSIPVATGFHTRFDDYLNHYGLRMLTPLAFAWLRRFHNRAQSTLVPTRELQEFLVAKGFTNVRHLQRAVDLAQFDPRHRDESLRAQWGLAPDDIAVIYVGRIAPEKNLDVGIRAFRSIARNHPSARFVWVGDGPARAKVEHDNPDFIFTGIRRGEDLSRHYASGDLFLFSSLSETFGNVTLEAMASGLATVAFDYGAAREHITGPAVGCAVACDDATAFVAAAVALADDCDRRRSMGANARHALDHLRSDSVASSFADLLFQLQPVRTAA